MLLSHSIVIKAISRLGVSSTSIFDSGLGRVIRGSVGIFTFRSLFFFHFICTTSLSARFLNYPDPRGSSFSRTACSLSRVAWSRSLWFTPNYLFYLVVSGYASSVCCYRKIYVGLLFIGTPILVVGLVEHHTP